MRKILMAGVLLALAGCYARPTDKDVDRVVEEFLHRRFNRSLESDTKSATDKDLLVVSCKRNQVRCDLVMERLKERDPDMYQKIMEGRP